MTTRGLARRDAEVKAFGLSDWKELRWNWSEARLAEAAVAEREAQLSAHGCIAAVTGQHTGRAPKDRYIVRDAGTDDSVWWDNANAMAPEDLGRLRSDMLDHAKGRVLYVQDLFGGADPRHRVRVRVYCELAWHSLFIRYLLRRPEPAELEDFTPDITIMDLPSFKADPARHGCRADTVIGCDFTRGEVLIGNTSYAGEMKKSVFTFLNYLLPPRGVMPMHCSANVGAAGDAALFFGLSGTGKTTLSADPSRTLLGDDEHGWSDDGIFNFEGGCYAKTIRLSAAAEPEIYATTQHFGTVFENVVIDPVTRLPDFDDGSLTENTRCAYPLHYIPNASATGQAGHPKNIVMLTCDAFGVMPPIARLDPSQAMYHFLSGYTAKVAGTETGVTEPEATFSTCFGAPFMPRHPTVYGNLLRDFIGRHQVDCWLVNTGWTGGRFGEGERMPIKVTRALLNAALDGSLRDAPTRVDSIFGFSVPASAPGVDDAILDPRSTWADKHAYDRQAHELARMFQRNFAKFESHVEADVTAAAPGLSAAAE